MSERRGSGMLARAAAEFVVIFAGVTLGLLADDWRQVRLETKEAQAALVLLEDDLINDSIDLVGVRGVLSRQSAAAVWVQRNWKRDIVDADSAGLAFRTYLFLPQFTFPRSAFESLRASNRLTLVQPDSVRAAVVEYYDVQSSLQRSNTNLVVQKERTVDAFSHYFLRPPARDSTSAWPMIAGPAEMTTAWSIVRRDNDLYNQVSYSGIFAAVSLSTVTAQQERNRTLLALLRAQGDN